MLQVWPQVIFVLYTFGVTFGLKNCNDCVWIELCPNANALQSDATSIMMFDQSLCGWEKLYTLNKPKICCSDFTTVLDRQDIKEDLVENHENLALLPTDCGKKYDSRIVNGEVADVFEYPWMALISYSSLGNTGKNISRFECGGTIINSRYILTAAHCIKRNIVGVRVGEWKIVRRSNRNNFEAQCQGSDNNDCELEHQDLYIEEPIKHEQYVHGKYYIHDIALIRTRRPINLYKRNIAPICLPVWKDIRDKDYSGETGTVAGWGITENGTNSDVLREADVPILTESNCLTNLGRDWNEDFRLVCAGGEGKDSCRGDSGGPLMVLAGYANGSNRVVQLGIVSTGSRLCTSLQPAAYTDVTKYVHWILDKIKA